MGVQMLRDVALEVLVERGVGASAGRPLSVVGHGGELTCDCSKVQYDLLLRVFFQNFAGKGDARARSVLTGQPSEARVGLAGRLLSTVDLALPLYEAGVAEDARRDALRRPRAPIGGVGACLVLGHPVARVLAAQHARHPSAAQARARSAEALAAQDADRSAGAHLGAGPQFG